MLAFYVSDQHGWGGGKTITEALTRYRKYNHNMPRGQKYSLSIFETPDPDKIQFDIFEWTGPKGTEKLYEEILIA
jgi:hypothetical protein